MLGPGRSAIAKEAFKNGAPAITLGNTIYMQVGQNLPMADLSSSPDGCEMLLHESTHVYQYATIGFARFLTRYGLDWLLAHGKSDEMYRYDHRHRDRRKEMIEGEAQIVGQYARVRRLPDSPKNKRLFTDLAARLRGTHIY